MILNKREILIAYLTALRKSCEPLYEYQKPKIKMELEYWKKQMEKINGFQILDDLSDKDLIIKFHIKPSLINMRYIGVEIDKIQENLKTDFEQKLEVAEQQLDI